MAGLLQDLRYGLRMLARSPGFAAVAVLALALGIGATTAIFSVVNGVLLRPLPYEDPGRLVMLTEGIARFAGNIPFSAPDFEFFRHNNRSFTDLAAYQDKGYELSGIDEPHRLTGARVSASLLPLLGVQPALGRAFTEEEVKNGRQVVVLSDSLWHGKFGGDPQILGRTITLDRKPYTVIGIMPRQFSFPTPGPAFNDTPAALFVPISFTPTELQGYGMMFNHSVVARLTPGVTLAQAQSEMRTLAVRMYTQYPAVFRQDPRFGLEAAAAPLREEIVGHVRPILLVLLAAVGVVLLIGCADVASLMLTRAVARHREMAVRTALGASRARLVRQLLTESVLLGLAGGALGVVVAVWGTGILTALVPANLPLTGRVAISGPVLGFAALVSLVTALLFGAAPSLEASHQNVADGLKEGGRSGTVGRRQRRWLSSFVMAQFALALVLLISAGLLLGSFVRLLRTDPGFQPQHLVSLSTSLPAQAYPRAAGIRAFYERLLERAQGLPGVKFAAISSALPLQIHERRVFTGEGLNQRGNDDVTQAWVLGDYFKALGIPLEKGRLFTPDDRKGSEPVILINEAMAQRYWPHQDPIGQRVKWGIAQSSERWMTIVGVVGNVKQGGLSAATIPQTYTPYLQESDDAVEDSVTNELRSLSLVVRTVGAPSVLIPTLQTEVHDLDPSLAVYDVQTLDQLIDTTRRPQQFNALLVGLFAALAVVLAVIGIYGVISYSVTEQTHEIGIRMALGATAGEVLKRVLGHGMRLAVGGAAIGVVASVGLTRFLVSLLYEVKPTDSLTFLCVVLVLLGVAFVACYIPAHRAAKVDPMIALRYE